MRGQSKAERFLFDTSFDEKKAEDVLDLQPDDLIEEEEGFEAVAPPPTFTEEELEAARQAAHAQGKEEGYAAAQQAIEAEALATLNNLASSIPELFRQYEESIENMLIDSGEIAALAVRKIAPELAKRNGTEEITALVRQTLQSLLDEPRVVIRLPADLLEQLRERLEKAARQSGFEGQLVLLPGENLEGHDCRLEWASGGAERMTTQIWQQIEDVFDRYLPQSETDSDDTQDEPPAEDISEEAGDPAQAPEDLAQTDNKDNETAAA